MYLLLLAFFSLNAASAQSPQLAWAKAIRTSVNLGREDGKHMAIDAQGNVYTAGIFRATVDFDPGPGTYNITPFSGDTYIQKLDASGNFLWAKSIGGPGGVANDGIAVDASGNVYLTGTFDSTADFDPGPGSFPMTASPNFFYTLLFGPLLLTRASTAYICKLNSSGDFVWAKKIDNAEACSIAIDLSGNVYTTGYFRIHTDFDPGPATAVLTPAAPDSSSYYLLKLNSAGDYVWAKHLVSHGVSLGDGFGVAGLQTDAAGNIYTCGVYGYLTGTTGDFDPGPGTFIMNAAGYSAGFISKLDSSANFIWAKKIDGPGVDLGQNLTLDASGNVYFTGAFEGKVDFDPGTGTDSIASAGGLDAFLVKLDAGGNYKWAKTFGGKSTDFSNTVRTDALKNIYVGGAFEDTVDFDPGPGTAFRYAAGFEPDGYIMRMDSTGKFVWATDIGKDKLNKEDFCWNLEVDGAGNVYVTGGFSDTVDFDPGPGVSNLVGGSYETFVMKLSQPGLSVAPLSSSKNDIRIYPNPAAGMVTLESKVLLRNARIRMMDVSGRTVRYWSMQSGSNIALDLGSQAPGFYVIEVNGEEGYAQRLSLLKR